MSDEANRSGQISSTPEGGPIDAGAPSSEPGAGQVRATPEAVPAEDDVELVPPTWQEHMQGPIPGMDDAPAAAREPAQADAAGSTPSTDWKGVPLTSVGTPSAGGDDEEPRTRPPTHIAVSMPASHLPALTDAEFSGWALVREVVS